MLYALFPNGRRFSILLFTCKLALVASFKFTENILLNFEFNNEATSANLQVNERTRCILTMFKPFHWEN